MILLKAMNDLSRFESTLRTASGLLRQIPAEISDVGEVEIRATHSAVRVSRHRLFRSRVKRGEIHLSG